MEAIIGVQQVIENQMKGLFLGKGRIFFLGSLEDGYFRRQKNDGIFHTDGETENDGEKIICFPVSETGRIMEERPVKMKSIQLVIPVSEHCVIQRRKRR